MSMQISQVAGAALAVGSLGFLYLRVLIDVKRSLSDMHCGKAD